MHRLQHQTKRAHASCRPHPTHLQSLRGNPAHEHKFHPVPEGDRPRSDGNAVTPNTTVASQSVQSIPSQPVCSSTRSRQYQQSAARRRRRNPPPTAGIAAPSPGVGPTERKGPCPHPETEPPETEPLPTTPPPGPAARAAPPVGSATAHDPALDAAELPPSSPRRAAGEVEADEGESCAKIQSNLQCPVDENCRHTWALFFGEASVAGEEGPVLATPDLHLLVPCPPLRYPCVTPAMIFRTSPPPRQNVRVRSTTGTGGVSNAVPGAGGNIPECVW